MILTATYLLVQANIFVHFIPVDHDDMNAKDHFAAKAKKPPSLKDRIKSAFAGLSTPKKLNIGGHEQDNHDEVRIICILQMDVQLTKL